MAVVFTLSSGALSKDATVLAFEGREAISMLYRFDILFLAPDGDDVDLGAAVGQRATLKLKRDDGKETEFDGILAEVELVLERVRQDRAESLYRALLVPRFWQLTHSRHSCVFIEKSVPDILKDVFTAGGLSSGDDYELRLNTTYSPLDHVYQYRESRFHFVSRWMEREGIYYFFEHGNGAEKLVLVDAKSSQDASVAGEVKYVPLREGDVTAQEGLERWTCRHVSRAQKVHIEDYDYLKPMLALQTQEQAETPGLGGEIHLHGDNHYTDPGEGKRLAKVRSEELAARSVVYHGAGRAFDLRSGYTFSLTEHPRAAFNAKYLAVAVTHRGLIAGAQDLVARAGMAATPPGYTVEVEAIPDTAQFRPERVTRVPRIYGYEIAVVDGEADSDYAQLDDHGRYLVKIKFDESGLTDGKASMRVRMQQPHGGDPEGFHFPLRKGTEVLLIFLGGDPDRPLIAGTVPNPQTPSLVTKSNNTKNVLQTGGQNRLEIEDQDGQQWINLSTPTQGTHIFMGAANTRHDQRHHSIFRTEGHHHHYTGGDADLDVKGKQTEHVVSDVSETYDAQHTKHVTGAVKETYDTSHDTTVNGPHTHKITGTQQVTVDGSHTSTYNSSHTTTVNGSKTHTNNGSHTTTVNGPFAHTTTGPHTTTVTGAHTTSVTGSHTVSVVGAHTTLVNSPLITAVAGNHATYAPTKSEQVGMKTSMFGYYSSFGIMRSQMGGIAVSKWAVSSSNSIIGISNTGMVIKSEGPKVESRAVKIACGVLSMIL